MKKYEIVNEIMKEFKKKQPHLFKVRYGKNIITVNGVIVPGKGHYPKLMITYYKKHLFFTAWMAKLTYTSYPSVGLGTELHQVRKEELLDILQGMKRIK